MNLAILPLFSFLGGAGATWLVYRIGASKFGTSVTIMLLAGVAISAISGAVIGYLNFLADDQTLRDLSLWSMGSLAASSWSSIMLALVTMLILYGYFAHKAMPLNALLLGEAEARHLGIDVQSLKRGLITLAAVGVGVTVSICGAVGFIGLVILILAECSPGRPSQADPHFGDTWRVAADSCRYDCTHRGCPRRTACGHRHSGDWRSFLHLSVTATKGKML